MSQTPSPGTDEPLTGALEDEGLEEHLETGHGLPDGAIGPDPSRRDRNAAPRRKESTSAEEAMAPGAEQLHDESAYSSSAHGPDDLHDRSDSEDPDRPVVDVDGKGGVSVHDPEGERHVAKANKALDDPA
jgi:hypothetical protein